jgi:hypothetical protein
MEGAPKTSVYRPPPGTPFGDAYVRMERDLYDQATDEELDWLEDNPLMWLRALSRMEAVIQAQMGIAKIALNKLAPRIGSTASQKYLNAKRAHDEKHKSRIHLLTLVGQRREEAKSLLSDEALVTMTTVGDLLDLLQQIVDCAKEDDFEQIEEICNGMINRINRRISDNA